MKTQVTKLMGVVLSGGLSTRMGTDKGLLKKDASLWADIAFQKLKPFTNKTLISISQDQLQAYLKYFDRHCLLNDHPDLQLKGPLRGLLTANMLYPEFDILVLASDMIYMTQETLSFIVSAYLERYDSNVSFYGFASDRFYEPLCGIYAASALHKWKEPSYQAVFNQGGFQNLLSESHCCIFPLSNGVLKALQSVNEMDSLS